LPEIEREKLKEIFEGKTIGTKNLNRFDEYFPSSRKRFSDCEDSNLPWENAREYRALKTFSQQFKKSGIPDVFLRCFEKCSANLFFKDPPANRHRNIVKYNYFKHIKERFDPRFSVYTNSFFIRPCWGCLGNCSYCSIKQAIGPLHSKPLDVVVREFSKGLHAGYNNFILDADDLGAYGQDTKSNFVEMLDAVTELPGTYKVYLRYIHSHWLVAYIDQFSAVLQKGNIRSVSSAIQSASPRILRLMHRYSDIDKIRNAFTAIAGAKTGVQVATECINGFPTETAEEFNATLEFVHEMKFHWGLIYPFSVRPGTKAEDIHPKIPEHEIIARMKDAKKHLKKMGYKSTIFYPQNIMTFMMDSEHIEFDDGMKSFCFSTID
jgi:tRNA A37 methylthiotransferase MiaB